MQRHKGQISLSNFVRRGVPNSVNNKTNGIRSLVFLVAFTTPPAHYRSGQVIVPPKQRKIVQASDSSRMFTTIHWRFDNSLKHCEALRSTAKHSCTELKRSTALSIVMDSIPVISSPPPSPAQIGKSNQVELTSCNELQRALCLGDGAASPPSSISSLSVTCREEIRVGRNKRPPGFIPLIDLWFF